MTGLLSLEAIKTLEGIFPSNSIWTYKDKTYQVNGVLPNNRIQFEDEWYPTVRYTCYPADGLVFYRSTKEFHEKFIP